MSKVETRERGEKLRLTGGGSRLHFDTAHSNFDAIG